MITPRSIVVVVSVVLVGALTAGSACLGRGRAARGLAPSPVGLPSALFTMPTRPVCEGDNSNVVDVAAVVEPALREVSGLASSQLNDDILWMLADSGNEPAVFALSATTGDVRLQVNLPVKNVDFEDLSMGPCPDLSGPCLFVSDTGDNDGVRTTVVVYAFPEPTLSADAAAAVVVIDTVWVMPMDFPGGERIDVEAVVVFPDASAILLFEKTTAATARIFVYRSPWSSTINGFHSPARTLEQSGTISVPTEGKKRERRITGAALHWSGTRLLVRFSGGLVEYVAADAVSFMDLHLLTPRQQLWSPPGEEQGEALTYSADGLGLFSIAEAAAGDAPVLHHSGCVEVR